jgi:hypothetical protein
VLSLVLADFHEQDSKEGSNVLVDHVHDLDILIGAKSSQNRNRAIWFEGLPDKYVGDRYYNANPNYAGNSANQINFIASGQLDDDDGAVNDREFKDAVAAAEVTDTQGGFEVWINQGGVYDPAAGSYGKQGHLGTGASVSAYYSNGSGAGTTIALGDFDNDGDRDVVLGTRTSANNGKLEFWVNNGDAVFTQLRVKDAQGEVNAVAVADFNNDGWPDVAAGTKTTNSENDGKLEVWLNTQTSDFNKVGDWTAGGQILTLAAGGMDNGSTIDIVAGTRTGTNRGEVELWLNQGGGYMVLADKATADSQVYSVAVGDLELTQNGLDIAAGTEDRSIQVWFCDPNASVPSGIIPATESWADANAGGVVNALAIGKVEKSVDYKAQDPLNDIVVGTAITETTGEIVIYLNPYVWTLLTTP